MGLVDISGDYSRVTALAANLCPLSVCPKVAGFAEDFSKPVGEAVEATAGSAVWQRPAKHLEHMLSGEQRIDQSIEASSGSERCPRLRSKMPRFGMSQLEFPVADRSGPRRDSASSSREKCDRVTSSRREN